MRKSLRDQVFRKYGGRCAYCGQALVLGHKMQVDHIEPVFRNRDGDKERIKEGDTIENLNPACIRCNQYKSTMSIETFRAEIKEQVARARRKSRNFRIAEDYGLIKETGIDVVFYFEKVEAQEK